MSESAGKTFRGLQEAYASIYADKSENLTEETVVDELQEDYVINEEALHETMVNYLVHFGYASDEKKAEWLEYRQALRDITTQDTWPNYPVWPIAPSK